MSILDRLAANASAHVLSSFERAWLGRRRAELLADARGAVVEVGAGSGANLEHYPATVQTVSLVDQSTFVTRRLRARAQRRGDRPPLVEVVEARAEALPFPDGSLDHVVSTFTLCTVEDLTRSIREIRRVLRPAGTLLLLEHSAATGRPARTQRLLEPLWPAFSGGCHLTRDLLTALSDAGFDTTGLETAHRSRLAVLNPVLYGAARVRPGWQSYDTGAFRVQRATALPARTEAQTE